MPNNGRHSLRSRPQSASYQNRVCRLFLFDGMEYTMQSFNDGGPKTKHCKRCSTTKVLTAFSACSDALDGKQSWCKGCAANYTRSDAFKRTKKKYATSDAGKEQIRKYRATDAGKESRCRINQKYHEKHPEQRKASRALNYAIAAGKINRQPCAICGAKDQVHGHHEDYSKPLDVLWLCRKHHILLHQHLREVANG